MVVFLLDMEVALSYQWSHYGFWEVFICFDGAEHSTPSITKGHRFCSSIPPLSPCSTGMKIIDGGAEQRRVDY